MIEQIKKDREERGCEVWSHRVGDGGCVVVRSVENIGHLVACDMGEDDARRIARVPELEEYVLEAHELLKEVLAGACVNYAYIAPRHIERIKKLVGGG